MHCMEAIICLVLAAVYTVQGASPGDRKCEECPHTLITPICGSDGRLYKNTCDMSSAACWFKKDITEVPWKDCKPKTCNVACTYEYTPVCGEDGNIYSGNRCTFLWESCGRPQPLNEAPMSSCENKKNNKS